MRNFLALTDLTAGEITQVFDRADELYRRWQTNDMPKVMTDMTVGLWFYGNGFRNRTAFEIGLKSMGADVVYLPGELGVNEPIKDIGHYLKEWFSMLVIRAKRHEDLVRIASDADIPTINARTNYNHPCEIIGDLQYIRRERGTIDGLNVVFVGEVTNLCMSWFEAAVRLPICVIQVAPEEYVYPEDKVKESNRKAIGSIATSTDLKQVISSNTDVLYTDCWPCEEEAGRIKKLFLPYQINRETVESINHNGFFLPCPPVTRGQEVTVESLDSRRYKNFEAKQFLLHSQNAIIEFLAQQSGTNTTL